MSRIRLDLNNPQFQTDLFSLEKKEKLAVIKTLEKISNLSWEQIYQHKGLHWERILSVQGPHGIPLYSIRITQKMRAVVYRDGDWIRFLTLHPDHDSAY